MDMQNAMHLILRQQETSMRLRNGLLKTMIIGAHAFNVFGVLVFYGVI